MKIRIIGASGFGKTYLAKKLANKYGISIHSLDDLFWENSHASYNVKRNPVYKKETQQKQSE